MAHFIRKKIIRIKGALFFGYKLIAIKNPEKLFLRFYRESYAKQSTGLGLAIVKKICDLYGFKISYDFEHNNHLFSIDFNIEKLQL